MLHSEDINICIHALHLNVSLDQYGVLYYLYYGVNLEEPWLVGSACISLTAMAMEKL